MASNGAREVGVINPKFLYQYGIELHLTRIGIHDWSNLLKKLRVSNIDIYTLFGPYDLLCRNYSVRKKYELRQLFEQYDIPDSMFSEPLPFEVESIAKHEGCIIDWEKEIDLQPTAENLGYLDEIQDDWNSIDKRKRDYLTSCGVVYPKNGRREYNEVKAFVFIRIPGAGEPKIFNLSKDILEEKLLKKWDDKISGLYWSKPNAEYHCVVEINVDTLKKIKEFVMDDCQDYAKLKVKLETATHIALYSVTDRKVPISEILSNIPILENLGQVPKEPKVTPKLSINEILADMENLRTELKATLRWNVNSNKKDNQMEKNVAKTIAAFMNTEGGILVIGVADDRSTYGLEADIQTLKRKDLDGFNQDLLRVIREYLGRTALPSIHPIYQKRDGKDICIVYVDAGFEPTYLRDSAIQPIQEEFYIRAAGATIKYEIHEALSYIRNHWPEYRG